MSSHICRGARYASGACWANYWPRGRSIVEHPSLSARGCARGRRRGARPRLGEGSRRSCRTIPHDNLLATRLCYHRTSEGSCSRADYYYSPRPPPPVAFRSSRERESTHAARLGFYTLTHSHTHGGSRCSCTRARGTGRVTTGGALPSLHTLHPSPLLRPPPPRAPVPGLRRATHPPCGPLTRAGSIPTRHRTRTLRFLPDLAAHPNVLLLVSSRSRSPDFRALLSSPLEESREKVADPTRGRRRVEEPRLGRVGRGERSERGKWVK